MAVTIATVKTLMETYLGDSTDDRVTDTEKNNLITEATSWLLEELGNEHMINTYDVDYFDGVNYYKVTTGLADLLQGADLRRGTDDHTESFARKSPREMAEEIGSNVTESAWAVERKDGDAYLVINHVPKYRLSTIDTFEDATVTWTADTTNSDATNLTVDTNEFTKGTRSLNFDLDVSQSGNNYATIYRNDYTYNLGDFEDLGSFIMDVYIPDNIYTTSFTLYFGSGSSITPTTKTNYWSATVTTDINGNAFANGWNKIKVDWEDTSLTGTPDAESITYVELRLTYNASQADDTDYRLDNFCVTRPEKLTFHYVSWDVGENSGGTALGTFTADTDVPFYSGRYDQYKHVVAHKAASLAFYSSLRLPQEGAIEEAEALKALRRYRNIFESSTVKEQKNFKIKGVSLGRYGRRRRFPRL